MLMNMKDDAQPELETEPDAWAPLAAANTKALNNLFETPFGDAAPTASPSGPHEKQDEERDEHCRAGDGDKQRDQDHRRYVDYGLAPDCCV
jgi:hypothetical protein